jgi:hypothetical protein
MEQIVLGGEKWSKVFPEVEQWSRVFLQGDNWSKGLPGDEEWRRIFPMW